MDLIRLIYTSRATIRLSTEQLRQLLAKSKANNLRRGITGMLCVWDGMFAQCLEGQPSEVDRTSAKISADHRHTDVNVISRIEVEHRHFGDWSMHLVLIDEGAVATELVRDKYPKLAEPALNRDPMVVFALLCDLAIISKAA